MKQVTLNIELLEDVVLNERSASVSGLASLDYIPGAALLGVAAATLYPQLSSADAFDVFHSGALRFGCALPHINGEVGYPAPRCLHFDKENKPKAGEWLADEALLNFAVQAPNELSIQPKALRENYVTESGHLISVRTTSRLRTAIDATSRRAAEGQLFGYQAIEAGQNFQTVISATDSITDSLFNQVVESLCGTRYLGRSRAAEYGRVMISRASSSDNGLVPAESSGALTLWLLSDLALLDDHGQPLLAPDGAALGLPGGQLDLSRSFLATRQYAPYNGHRRGRDTRREVIVAGSVLTLIDAAPLTDEDRSRLAAGIGLHVEQGLGRIAAQPQLLSGPHPVFAERPSVKVVEQVTSTKALTQPFSRGLMDFLTKGADQIHQADQHEADALRLFRGWVELLTKAAFHHPDGDYGPSAQQWGAVRDAASAHNGAALKRALFEGKDAVCKATGEGWGDSHDGNKVHSFASWLETSLGESPSGRMVAALAREAQRAAKKAHEPMKEG